MNIKNMNTLELKTDIISLVDKIEDNAILQAIHIILLKQVSQEQPDFWDTLPNLIQEDILISLEQVQNNELIPHEEVMTDIKIRYLK